MYDKYGLLYTEEVACFIQAGFDYGDIDVTDDDYFIKKI